MIFLTDWIGDQSVKKKKQPVNLWLQMSDDDGQTDVRYEYGMLVNKKLCPCQGSEQKDLFMIGCCCGETVLQDSSLNSKTRL